MLCVVYLVSEVCMCVLCEGAVNMLCIWWVRCVLCEGVVCLVSEVCVSCVECAVSMLCVW